MIKKPAILRGEPIFNKLLQLTVPDFPSWDLVKDKFEDIFEKETIFTRGKYLKTFESNLSEYLQVKHAICVSSCTSGLMLTYKGLDLSGEVILPSFTFMATGQALMWQKDVTPVFVDVDKDTFNLDVDKIEEAITPKTTAIVAAHIYGNPANIVKLEEIAKKHNLKLVFDAAHGVGTKYKGKSVGGFGNAECFSLSPTKILITGEGGIVATNDDKLAEFIKLGREYGNPGNYDSLFAGMNARMGEFNAVMGIECLKMVDDIIKTRNKYANCLTERLSQIEGIRFQKIDPENLSTYKDYTIVIEKEFGLNRDQLVKCLKAENVSTRNYYSPALHQQTTYKQYAETYKGKLPVTEHLCNSAVTLPLSSKFTLEEIENLAKAIERIYKYRKEINNN